MFTMVNESTRRSFSAMAAVTMVAFSGLTLEQGHLGALPQGTVEVGELTPVNLMQMAAVTLPEIVVTAERVQSARLADATIPVLPEVVVVASRGAQRVAVVGRGEEPVQG